VVYQVRTCKRNLANGKGGRQAEPRRNRVMQRAKLAVPVEARYMMIGCIRRTALHDSHAHYNAHHGAVVWVPSPHTVYTGISLSGSLSIAV
jgi:hypothetical protein